MLLFQHFPLYQIVAVNKKPRPVKRIVALLALITIVPLFSFAQQTFDSLRVIRTVDVYFDFGKSAIRPEADSVLQLLAKEVANLHRLKIDIRAHTDAIGNPNDNITLSQNRADSVKARLNAYGLPDSLMEATVFGESQPIATNNTDEGRQRNRRATVKVMQWSRMTRLAGKIADPETGKGIESEIILRQKEGQDTMRTDTSGDFEFVAPVGAVVGVDVYAEGYFFETQMLKVNPKELPKLEIKLKPVKSGESIDLKNFYFVGNQAILLEHSEPELGKLLKFMHINPSIQIEIAGHINRPNEPPVAETSWDYGLSVRRAKLVYDYLLDNGIPAERLTYKGYGNSQMRFPNARSEEHQKLNRRVEIKVLSTGKVVSQAEN